MVLADKVFLSSTFFPNSDSIVAALKTIEILERDKVLDVVKAKGEKFAIDVQKVISESGIPAEFSGGPWMPFVTFPKDETGLYKKLRTEFYTQLIRRKVFLQRLVLALCGQRLRPVLGEIEMTPAVIQFPDPTRR